MTARSLRGFTLLELLLVVLVTSLLLGLLFPTFAAARKQARLSVCTNNLRQVGVACRLYAEDYEYYPDPLILTRTVSNRKLLYCPDDPQLKPNASSYTFRSALPPTFEPYWRQRDVDPNTVLAYCPHHLKDEATPKNTSGPNASRAPFRLALRANGSVTQIPEEAVRELAVPGRKAAFVRVYPGERYYDLVRR